MSKRYSVMHKVCWKDLTKDDFLKTVKAEGLSVLPQWLCTSLTERRTTQFWNAVSEVNASLLREGSRGLRIRYGNTDANGTFKAKSGGFLQFVGDTPDAASTGGKKPTFLFLEGEYPDRGGRHPRWSVQLLPGLTLAIQDHPKIQISTSSAARRSPPRHRTSVSPSTKRVRG